ncbi:exodeoxyribonuclease V subunit alpha [Crenobacter cavernae]|uniref:RecBCD enzyme subunit RecD n=1 Tax=Crenobacter cavernae TaxID=2290923 RepID=A0ABY0FEQ6_9NEIS|nr:exodeoxyribonuclease V subunit alpha [Crenobacter cavernae]RXZ44782.1 exodeoxyribonuclease V subunit alpha [Crenobacter cavernae]
MPHDDARAPQLAALFKRLDPALPCEVEGLVARLINANGTGHVCLPLSGAEARSLAGTSIVGRAGGYAPLIVDAQRRLYFARHWYDEHRLAATLARLAREALPVDAAAARGPLDALFGADAGSRQRLAAALALRQRFLLIAGGPGTGKTTTVVRLLALIAATSARPPVIAMAAPTGKAAARLSESVRAARDALPVSAAVKALLPERAQTLHRLLGLAPGAARARHHKGAPLPLDVLVVDEGSMVDLSMMARVADALPSSARLIVLGDPDQLASVEAGSVLADLAIGEAWRPDTVSWLAEAGCVAPPESGAAVLPDCVVRLTQSHRFDAKSAIGRLARAVNAGDAADAGALLDDPAEPDATWLAAPDGLVAALFAARAGYFELVKKGAAPDALFAAFSRHMLLCSERRAVENMNRAFEARLEAAGLKAPGSDWYPGRAVMVTVNDYAVGLFNGDVGILVETSSENGPVRRVLFPEPDGGFRALAPGRLPAHETVFAMTVHKSQGSEFDEVWLALHGEGSASRALVYTAITRARRRFALAATPAQLASALACGASRASGLADQLAAQADG